MMSPEKSASARIPVTASPGLREGLRGDEYLYAPPPPAPVVAGKDASAVNPTLIEFPDEYVREHGVGLRIEQHGHGLM
jgi:hypothetical protein